MNQIKKETLNLKIQNSYAHTFEIPADGIYLIEITASAKSWWQNTKNFKSFFQDDDLAIKIDGIEFPKLNGKKGLFDGEVAWNGNNLKGLSKTNIFLINLSKGSHDLDFLADQAPTLENISICQIDEIELRYIPTKNNPAQDGNRRQWITIITVNLVIKKINIKASAKNYPENADDDDIKLILDGRIELNTEDKSHKNWFWCGRTLAGEEKEFSRELNWQAGLHYVELWADRMPKINTIDLVLEIKEQENSILKRIPTIDDPEWTGNFDDDTEQMILARALWGEARSESKEAIIAIAWSVKNRLGIQKKWDSYHHILLAPSQYSCFWEKAPDDPNLQKLRSPLKTTSNPSDHAKWKETYEIAGQVILEKIADSTNGANHYYDDSILSRPASEIPIWIKTGKVILKLGRLNFLQIK